MNLFILLLGVLITGTAMYDIIYTTFAPSGSSYISHNVTSFTWKLMLLISRRTGKRYLLKGAGVIIICFVLLAWIASIWVGVSLIFSSDPQAVLNLDTNTPADYSDRIYYSGYVLSTLGNGDFRAGSNEWQIFTAIVSFFGLMLITIAISYMVPVLSAVTDRRALSIQIASLGHSPEAILLNHWDGKSFKRLETNLLQLREKIALHGQLHLSYPILQYFQNNEKLTALMPNLIALDEALTILHYRVPEHNKPESYILEPMRLIVNSFFDSLAKTSSFKACTYVPAIRIDKLKDVKIDLIILSEDQLNAIHKRRLFLNSILENCGWYWDEIYDDLHQTRFS
jgi:hypothetical protein